MTNDPHDVKKKAVIQVRLDRDFLDEIDRRAYGKHLSRNAYIKTCIQQSMTTDDHNEWVYHTMREKLEKDPKAALTDAEKLAMKHHNEPLSFL